ncbi:FtsX-like permease family protein, partial [uncultured Marinobacter sp.]|uniref:ABC transporter permease n=1 Tax=uncultured Marinobacter sp. TaxID=187379 RepID=UPI0030DD35C6
MGGNKLMLLRALLSHYRRHPLQLLALWLILALATALWTGVWSLTQQARTSMTAGEEQLSGRQQLVRTDGSPVTRADFVDLRRQGLCVMPWLEVAPAGGGPRQVGVDALAMGCAGDAAATGDGNMGLDGRPFVDIAEAARMVHEEGARGQLRLYLATGSDGVLPENWQLRGDVGQLSTGQLADSFLLNLDALCVLVLLITALLVRSVYSLGLAQRRESLGLLVRYGVPLNRLRRCLLQELLVLGALAVLPGYWLGLQLSRLLSSGFAAAMTSLFDTPLLETGRSLTSLALIALVMLLVLVWAALDLFRTDTAATRLWSPALAGAVLMVTGAVLVLMPEGLVWIFLGTGLLLLGAGLVTPLLLQRTLRTGARLPALTLWRQREAGVLVRRLGLPLVALQFAAATVIAVQALVTTFEDTFYEWLAQRLSGDVYMEVPDGREVDEVRDLLAGSPVIRHWHPVIRGQGELGGQSIDVMATDPASPLLQTWHLLDQLPDPWLALQADAV